MVSITQSGTINRIVGNKIFHSRSEQTAVERGPKSKKICVGCLNGRKTMAKNQYQWQHIFRVI